MSDTCAPSGIGWGTCSRHWAELSPPVGEDFGKGGKMAGFGDPHLTTVDAHGLRLGIVGSRWHSSLVDHMVDRAQEAAKACGVDDVVVTRVAGSVELPIVAQALAQTCDAV